MDFKDPIPAAGGKIEFLVDAEQRISIQISSLSTDPGFRAFYQVAVSLDGRHAIDEVPVTGLGQAPIYRQPSIVTYIQSDEHGFGDETAQDANVTSAPITLPA